MAYEHASRQSLLPLFTEIILYYCRRAARLVGVVFKAYDIF